MSASLNRVRSPVFIGRSIDSQLEAAEARGRDMLNTEPRAVTARYDRASAQVVIDLVNGCTYAFSAKLAQDLQGASDDDLAGA
jgi:hypothetical protein